jgi:hypothetical protein
VEREQRIRFLGAKIMKRWHNGCIGVCLDCWTQYWEGQVAVRAELKRMMSKWGGQKQEAAFIAWSDEVVKEKRSKEKCAKVVGRMLKATLVSAFEAWVEGADTWRRHRVFIAKMKHKYVASSQAGMFTDWATWAHTERSTRRKMVSMMRVWKHKDVGIAFGGWERHWYSQRKIRAASIQFQSHQQIRTLDTWRTHAKRRRTATTAARRVFNRWHKSSLANCLYAWQERAQKMNHWRVQLRLSNVLVKLQSFFTFTYRCGQLFAWWKLSLQRQGWRGLLDGLQASE